MQITVHLPDDFIQHSDPSREALEALAVEGYRSGVLSHFEAAQLMELSRFEFDALLKERKIYDHAYDVEDLAQDMASLHELRAKGHLQA